MGYKINNFLNMEKPEKDHWGDHCKEKVTVPGMAYTVKELVDRIKRGRPVVEEV